jgi:hypothetical protein
MENDPETQMNLLKYCFFNSYVRLPEGRSSVFLDHFPLQTIRLLVFFGGKPAPSKKVAIS